MFDHFISRLFRFYRTWLGKLCMALLGLALALSFVALQPMPVKASQTATVLCGLQSNYLTKIVTIGCSYECNVDGGGPDEAPEPIWTETGSSSDPNTAEVLCRNYSGTFSQTAHLSADTELQCLVGS